MTPITPQALAALSADDFVAIQDQLKQDYINFEASLKVVIGKIAYDTIKASGIRLPSSTQLRFLTDDDDIQEVLIDGSSQNHPQLIQDIVDATYEMTSMLVENYVFDINLSDLEANFGTLRAKARKSKVFGKII